jgi:hypothetical protein
MATELAPSVTDSDTADDIRASRIQRRPLVDAVSPGALAPATLLRCPLLPHKDDDSPLGDTDQHSDA